MTPSDEVRLYRAINTTRLCLRRGIAHYKAVSPAIEFLPRHRLDLVLEHARHAEAACQAARRALQG